MEYELLIQNGGQVYLPSVLDDVCWETERKSTPGKLTFSVAEDARLRIAEGNPVRLRVDGKNVFYGFLFARSKNKDGTLSLTAYDQTRYLKNKDTVVYEGITATQLIRKLAGESLLQCGELTETGTVLQANAEQDQTLFDVIQNALDETMQATGRLYVLYDEFGKLTLRDLSQMQLGLLIDSGAGEDFDYSSSIDENTYNCVKITCDDEKSGLRQTFLQQDLGNIRQWGLLQYHESVQNANGAAQKAKALLGLYNQKTRGLSISGVIGDTRVRGGSLLPVHLDLGDMKVQNLMLVQKVKHTFQENRHSMDLTLAGGEFLA